MNFQDVYFHCLTHSAMFNDTKFNVLDTRFHNTIFDGALIIIQSNWVAYFELLLYSSNEKLRLRIVIQWDCERPKEDFETGDDKLQKDGSTVRELLAMHSQRARPGGLLATLQKIHFFSSP